jgi:hypothetical protein
MNFLSADDIVVMSRFMPEPVCEFASCATADVHIPTHINTATAAVPNVFKLFFIFSPLVLSLKVLARERDVRPGS